MFHPQGPTFWELVAQALSSTEHGYDLLAPKFDHTPFCTPDAILAPAMTHLGEPGSIEAALDVCCGAGAAMWHLRRLCRHRVVGIDFSRGMLDIARRVVATAPGSATLELVRGNVLDMPFDTAFDMAVCVGALGHILPTDQARFVRQVAKVLRPGGRFVLVTAPMPPLWSMRYWLSRGFNAVMQVRNLCLSPPFVMYYLTFLLPQAVALLRQHGFSVDVYRDVFDGRFRYLRLVIGTLHEDHSV
jgi:ubiquinone/menaquinone biosynthesis C-methylase UbiE